MVLIFIEKYKTPDEKIIELHINEYNNAGWKKSCVDKTQLLKFLKKHEKVLKKAYVSDNELIKHLKEFKVYTPSYHKLHEDIINEMKLTEDIIKQNNILKCPSWICKESEFTSSEQLINHLQRLGIEPFWKKNMDFSKKEDYAFNKELKIYDTKNCIICLDRNTNIIFDKCMHQCYCVECYNDHIKLNNTLKCPICRNFYNKIYPA